jgi:PhoH-like ATPase
MKVIDTNILLHNPNILEEIEDAVITIRVIEEIDGLKKNNNPEVAYQARRASYAILSNDNKITYCKERKDKLSVDDELVYFAKKHKWELITNDLNLQIKCRFNKVKCSGYSKVKDNYTGVIYLPLDFDDAGYNKVLEDMLNTKTPPQEMYENQFLIIQDKSKEVTDSYGQKHKQVVMSFICKNGKLEIVDNQFIKNKFVNTIKPRNAEQECLIKLLKDRNISIVLAAGTFGVGKSYLLINYALQELEKGNINKIIYVPNNSFNENTREIGALPGDLFDKESIHMGTLMDIVGPIVVEEMVNEEKIEVAPISTMRGRSFANCIIIVNEAQNLTEDHVKLLIARCGDGTRIFFDGDIKQADSHVFRNKNGLKLLSKLKNSPIFSKIFGTVRLVNIERSLTAQASAYLDDSI